MKIRRIITLVIGISSLFIIHAEAGKPLWTFTPLTATTFTLPSNSTATVQYTITNQSSLSHTLVMNSIHGITQLTSGVGVCAKTFTLQGKASCTLSLQVDGAQISEGVSGGPIVCQQGSSMQCYQPSTQDALHITQVQDTSATITASVSTLALSVNCPAPSASCTFSNAALTGTPRTITITNTSSNTAINVTYSTTLLPSGTSISPANCGNIAAGNTCILTITPGQTASTTETTLSVSGTNTNTVAPTLNILTYGSIYQGGYLFSMDDTTSTTGSAGGKILSLNDQSSGTAWDPGCPGSCTTSINANSSTDGLTNSINAYNALSLTHPANTYAVGLCLNVLIDDYNDWYLPAICEMGYDSSSSQPCGDVTNPTLQNIQSNLVDNGILPLVDSYWSSTQTFSVDPNIYATYNDFGAGGTQHGDFKEISFFVRCIRQLS